MLRDDPRGLSRQRYQKSLKSSIFDPPEDSPGKPTPPGKRIDQMGKEVFCQEPDRDGRVLRKAGSTFEPRPDYLTASDRRILNNATSPGLWKGEPAFQPWRGTPGPQDPHYPISKMEDPPRCYVGSQPAQPDALTETRLLHAAGEEWDEVRKPNRTLEEKAKERETLGLQPKAPDSPRPKIGETAKLRAIATRESPGVTGKSSGLDKAETAPPGTVLKGFKKDDNETIEEMQERRRNRNFSDLFGCTAPPHPGGLSGGIPADIREAEKEVVIFGDWTDSRTEMQRRSAKDADRSGQPFSVDPHFRKMQHSYESAIPSLPLPAQGSSAKENFAQATSDDVKRHSLMNTAQADGTAQRKHVSQAHLQSSLMRGDFYETAGTKKEEDTEVRVVNLFGLPSEITEEHLRQIASRTKCHVVRYQLDVDPVTNRCKGRARVTIRRALNDGTMEAFTKEAEANGARTLLE
uniref:Uncharacterized protein n=1 Tax=Chromera velia CCMP2878 TaxID=1169474 RepID=A0A0G4FBB8_9ALVE|eukprot:Cvel_3059.t1-p1 / transcript=Cvel_3059.t1 / gene=Cvel_3059 / organism=Chromera_velia_CCMP2878 / gene_product=hypothetical protein / transcript_product=hypothetical protein / location=Cvel_scaffold122:46369-51432(-) / protein_length=462 / sequence_SO=supercontig / SO=protein_coding / is_pseudo=false